MTTRRAIVAFATAMALPLCVAQAQPRGGWGPGPGWGGGWHGGWGGGGWAAPFVGGAVLGLGLGLLPYAAPPPAYYPPAPAYYPPPNYRYGYGYYGNPYPPGYYGNSYAPGYSGYASPPTPYPGAQAYAQQSYPAALDPNNCGTPDAPKPCSRR